MAGIPHPINRYLLALAVLLAGPLLFAVLLFSGIQDLTSGLVQVQAPGSANLSLSEAGLYTIFYEQQGVADGRDRQEEEEIPDLEIMLTSSSTGLQIPVYPASGTTSYSLGGRFGRSMMEFMIYQPGDYLLQSSRRDGQSGPRVILAVGQGMGGDIMRLVLEGLLLFVGSAVLAIVIIVKAHGDRRKRLLELAEEDRLLRRRSPPV
ncbi:MAG: hypothetical protein GKC10_06530 [Methanosarcinales archaeon]|nr:hypothetical protein [Methanosarcinales archaeon]